MSGGTQPFANRLRGTFATCIRVLWYFDSMLVIFGQNAFQNSM